MNDEITDTELLLNEAAGRAWLETHRRQRYKAFDQQRSGFEKVVYAFLAGAIFTLALVIVFANTKQSQTSLGLRHPRIQKHEVR